MEFFRQRIKNFLRGKMLSSLKAKNTAYLHDNRNVIKRSRIVTENKRMQTEHPLPNDQ